MSVLSLIVFAAAAILTIGSAFVLFIFKRVLHAVIAITFTFVGAAFILLFLGQSLLALMLLFVFVGGISTYLVVAVATELKSKTNTNIFFLVILSVVIFILTAFGALYSLPGTGTALGIDITQVIAEAFETQYALLYFMALLLFATTIGGVLVVKKFTKLLV